MQSLLTRLLLGGGGGFSPASLFTGGTAGAWYDPSDSTTLFSDTAGTTPSPTPGGGALSVVGLMLDKSQGLALGSELVTNGTFDSGTTGWSTSTGFASTATVVSGEFQVTASVASGRQISAITCVIGQAYVVTGVCRLISGTGSAFIGISDATTGGSLYTATTNSTSTFVATRGQFVATATTMYVVAGSTGGQGVTAFDNISVKSIPGNHAISYNTTTARPELSARVNLLTYSEQFDNAAWTKTLTTVSANTTATTDPLGGNTADKIIEGVFTGNSCDIGYSLFTHTTGVSYTLSVYAKSAERTRVLITWPIVGANNPGLIVDLSSGSAVSTNGSPTVAITNAGNGWWRISLTITAGTISSNAIKIGPTANTTSFSTTLGYNGDGTSGIYIWGADLRPANIGTSVPAYQRIADAYTYDSSGFPRYLVFNGTASGMYTPANLNLSGTDKATVFAGVRKQADPTDAMLAEFSSVFTNAGSFAVAAPWTSTTLRSYFVAVNGNAINSRGYTGYAAPISNVLSAAIKTTAADSDAAQDVRINAADVAGSSIQSAASTGNFGTYPLYIGSRNNASLWFNGYLYSLIVVGAASTAAQISSTESWINVKEGGVY